MKNICSAKIVSPRTKTMQTNATCFSTFVTCAYINAAVCHTQPIDRRNSEKRENLNHKNSLRNDFSFITSLFSISVTSSSPPISLSLSADTIFSIFERQLWDCLVENNGPIVFVIQHLRWLHSQHNFFFPLLPNREICRWQFGALRSMPLHFRLNAQCSLNCRLVPWLRALFRLFHVRVSSYCLQTALHVPDNYICVVAASMVQVKWKENKIADSPSPFNSSFSLSLSFSPFWRQSLFCFLQKKLNQSRTVRVAIYVPIFYTNK